MFNSTLNANFGTEDIQPAQRAMPGNQWISEIARTCDDLS